MRPTTSLPTRAGETHMPTTDYPTSARPTTELPTFLGKFKKLNFTLVMQMKKN